MTTRISALLSTGLAVAAYVSAPAPAIAAVKQAELEKAANVESGGLILYAPAVYASTYGGRMNVDFVSGVFAQSARHIHLLSYDRVSKSFRQDMSFETASIPGVALVAGPLGRRQLQIRTESGFVACNFGKLIDSANLASQIYERLIAAGVRTFESPGWIQPVEIPGPIVIPVYIPH
ncbi:hypothetical protein [Phenylobacterium sp.]|uniref:hypothetical protein n=1 Tax=Phenylobacterium sp. TaxID=1871053 RepID=UPI002B600D02|nr:hypothetical protein [Phenylobacterium sp.]HVI33668.1 hypothetical protein [Phenylobacterium sp.]